MITEIQDAIIARLEEIDDVIEVGSWQGDVDDLIRQPARLPALQVIYDSAEFSPKRLIGANQADHQMEFLVVLIGRNLRGRAEGAADCYPVIEAVRTKLIGYEVLTYGNLWPVREELVLAERGILAYGLRYRVETQVTV